MEEGNEIPQGEQLSAEERKKRDSLIKKWVDHVARQGDEVVTSDTFAKIMNYVDAGEAPPDVDKTLTVDVSLLDDKAAEEENKERGLSAKQKEELASIDDVDPAWFDSHKKSYEILFMERMTIPEGELDLDKLTLEQRFAGDVSLFNDMFTDIMDDPIAIREELGTWDDAKRRKYYDSFNKYAQDFAAKKNVGNTKDLLNTAEVYKKLILQSASDKEFVVSGKSKESKGEEEVTFAKITTKPIRDAYNAFYDELDIALGRKDKVAAIVALDKKWTKLANDNLEALKRDRTGQQAVGRVKGRLMKISGDLKNEVPFIKGEDNITRFKTEMSTEEFEKQRERMEKKEKEGEMKKKEIARLKALYPKIIEDLKSNSEYNITDDNLPSEEVLKEIAEKELFMQRLEGDFDKRKGYEVPVGRSEEKPEGKRAMKKGEMAAYEEKKRGWSEIKKVRRALENERDWSQYGWGNKDEVLSLMMERLGLNNVVAEEAAKEFLLYGQTGEAVKNQLDSIFAEPSLRGREREALFNYAQSIGAEKSSQLQQAIFGDIAKEHLDRLFQQSPKNFHELAWQIGYVHESEFGEYSKNPVYSRKVERIQNRDGTIRFKVHTVVNRENLNLFPMFMVNTVHGQKPREAVDFYGAVQIQKIPSYNALKLEEMLLNIGEFFSGSDEEGEAITEPVRDENGAILFDEHGNEVHKVIGHKVEDFRDVAQMWEIMAVLATVIRSWDIEYDGTMGSEKGVLESAQKFFYGNLMTKPIYGYSAWQWLLKLSEGYQGLENMDTKVGAGINTMFLAYANMSNFDKLQEMLGEEVRDNDGNIIYEYKRDKDGNILEEKVWDDEEIDPNEIIYKEIKAEGKSVTIRMKKVKRPIYDISDKDKSPLFHLSELIKIRDKMAKGEVDKYGQNTFINPDTFYDFSIVIDEKGNRKFHNKEVQDAFNLDGTIKSKRNFINFVNIFNNQGKDPQLKKIIEAAVKQTAKKRHHLSDDNDHASEFANILATHMPRWTGVAADNDIGRAGFDAQARMRRGYIKKYFDGRGGLGYPQIAGLMNEWMVTYINAIQTKDGKALIQVLEDLALIRRNFDSSNVKENERKIWKEVYNQRIEKVIFGANAERDYIYNHFARGLALDEFIRGAAPIRLQNYTHQTAIGTTVDLQKYQQDIIKGVLTPWRYAFGGTYSKLDYGMVRPGWDYDLMKYDETGKFQNEGWREMPFAERIFGREMIDIPKFWKKDKNGKYEYESYLDLNGKVKWKHKIDADVIEANKKEITRKGMMGMLVGQFLGEKQFRAWKQSGQQDWTYYEGFIDVLEKIPGNIHVDPFSMANTNISERFFTHEEMRWFRKHAHMTNMRVYSSAFFKALLMGDHKNKDGGAGLLGMAGIFSALAIAAQAITKQ